MTRGTLHHDTCAECSACQQPVITGGGYANGRLYHQVLSTFNRCQHNTTIFRTASSVTIADVSWRISSAVHRATSSAASASKYVDIYTMRTSFIDNQFKMATVNFIQLYQKTCSVCQCAITKDCVEGNGKFYHSNCIKVSTDYRDSN